MQSGQKHILQLCQLPFLFLWPIFLCQCIMSPHYVLCIKMPLRKYLNVVFSLVFFISLLLIYAVLAVGTLCKSLLRLVTKACVFSKGFTALTLVFPTICLFPSAKYTEENQNMGSKWSSAFNSVIHGCLNWHCALIREESLFLDS